MAIANENFPKRPPNVEEWDGYSLCKRGFISEDERIEEEKKFKEHLKFAAEFREKHGIPDPNQKLFNKDGTLKKLDAEDR